MEASPAVRSVAGPAGAGGLCRHWLAVAPPEPGAMATAGPASLNGSAATQDEEWVAEGGCWHDATVTRLVSTLRPAGVLLEVGYLCPFHCPARTPKH